MSVEPTQERWTIERVPALTRRKTVAEQVREGLSKKPKSLPPVLFYDERGSDLFVQITQTEDYYPTRCEREILETRSGEIAAELGDVVTVIELGSGSSEKTEILLRELAKVKQEVHYVPIDISEEALVGAAERLTAELPSLSIHCVVAEYAAGVERAARHAQGDTLVLVLGSNLGNFELREAQRTLAHVRECVDDDARMLVGLDLVKDVLVLLRAYDDSEQITEAFNLNMLERINRELDAEFDLRTFKHLAYWNAAKERMEMYLICLAEQEVRIGALDTSFFFEAGEHVHTEYSHKFTRESIQALADGSGWNLDKQWTDAQGYFSLSLFHA